MRKSVLKCIILVIIPLILCIVEGRYSPLVARRYNNHGTPSIASLLQKQKRIIQNLLLHDGISLNKRLRVSSEEPILPSPSKSWSDDDWMRSKLRKLQEISRETRTDVGKAVKKVTKSLDHQSVMFSVSVLVFSVIVRFGRRLGRSIPVAVVDEIEEEKEEVEVAKEVEEEEKVDDAEKTKDENDVSDDVVSDSSLPEEIDVISSSSSTGTNESEEENKDEEVEQEEGEADAIAAPANDDDQPTTEKEEAVQTEVEEETYIFSLFKPNDGSKEDPDGIPTRYLNMQKQNRHHAIVALNHTLKWRKDHDVDTILSRPHPTFDQCKDIFPHYFPGWDTSNHIVFVQRPGKIDLQELAANGLTIEDLITHYIYVIEYCWNILVPQANGVMTSVLDLTDVGWEILHHTTLLAFIRKVVSMMSENYPQRSYKTFIINAPRWFNSLFHMIKPLLRESTKRKIQIFCRGKAQDQVLMEFLGEAMPLELLTALKDDDHGIKHSPYYGGPHSVLEQELRSFCVKRLEHFGMEMEKVV